MPSLTVWSLRHLFHDIVLKDAFHTMCHILLRQNFLFKSTKNRFQSKKSIVLAEQLLHGAKKAIKDAVANAAGASVAAAGMSSFVSAECKVMPNSKKSRRVH